MTADTVVMISGAGAISMAPRIIDLLKANDIQATVQLDVESHFDGICIANSITEARNRRTIEMMQESINCSMGIGKTTFMFQRAHDDSTYYKWGGSVVGDVNSPKYKALKRKYELAKLQRNKNLMSSLEKEIGKFLYGY